ncbi:MULTISPECIES: carbohydrate ABC transporter permease [Paracoccus]|uniref:ABC transporter permease n=2 Tax=Paracoccus TaxID=265 RepID=A0A099EUF2_9RHOB|nr:MULTISPECIES: sugar ABC transporter permease [Paracoccus]KGJ01904.1 ABC transporter permease [Paracoccus halophilus]TNH38584.1 sugar ABC transporter permease [Paracoccus haeundaensis]SFA62090.1 carbohydrate ABC transporter membrane protein 1, CUT1 family (TC 3.A.1.1.-) [Paracoccus halophilus]
MTQGRIAFLLGAPALALMLVILILPILAAVVLSFTDYSLGAAGLTWVGLENYARIFGSSTYEKMLVATATYVAVVVPASIGLGLGAALLIQSLSRGAAFYKSVYFLPVMATLLAMTIVWQMMLHPTIGVVNRSLLAVCGVLPEGVCPDQMPLWLGDRNYAIWVTCFIGVWQGFGFNMVLYLAGLSGVSRELYGAAEMDGARSGWERFRLVTWPALRPTTTFVLITTFIRAFQTFDTVEVLFSPGGGPSKSVYLMMFAIYEKGIVQNLVGIGAAITVLFLISVMALTLLQRRLTERRA